MSDLPLGGSRPIPKHWKLYSVDEIKSPERYSCVAGPFGSNISSKYFVDQGVPVIRGKNLTDDLTRFVPENFVFVTEQRARQEYEAQHVQAGDLVFTCWGTIGQVGFIPEDGPYPEYIISNKQLKLRVNTEIANPLFVYYYLASREGAEHIRNRATGSAVPGINLGILKSLKIALPSLPTQEKIVVILSAYDDLIDNNNRRIALLEEAIHRLYREWFVHLRFPGHEHTPVFDGVPEGWEKRPIKDTFEILGGGTPSRKEERYWQDGTIDWYTPSDLTKTRSMFRDSSAEKISEAGFSNSSARMFPAYSVMMTSRATIGVIAINTVEATTNQGFITCIPNERVPLYFLYCFLTASANVFESFATGSTFKEISKGVFKKIPVLLPTQSLLKDFHEIVEPMAKQTLNLQRQNQYLTEARDALLPRLMNGSVSV